MVIQFALAAARLADDDWKRQDLGPIHVIKYVYLGDLAYAEQNGETFTGTPWRFHHFGPWAAEVFDRIQPAAQAAGADELQVESRYRDDFRRFKILRADDADDLKGALRRMLPAEVAQAVLYAVKAHGNDTTELLHDVYRTAPMLRAAPGELLVFEAKQVSPFRPGSNEQPPLRAKAVKRRTDALSDARMRFQERAKDRLQARDERRAAQPEPRYDEVFEKGTQYLDDLAGRSPAGLTGALDFNESIWKSTARTGPDDE